MSRFFTETPIWVWPLFILLLVLGLRARPERAVPVGLFYGLPFLGISVLLRGLLRDRWSGVYLRWHTAWVCGVAIWSSANGC
jgi:hypothetical protein